jgi:MOSC domain-containing protein YiiM
MSIVLAEGDVRPGDPIRVELPDGRTNPCFQCDSGVI